MATKKKKKHAAGTRELLVHMQVNRSNASVGGSGASVLASALITVLVTLDGVPVTDLGANAGNGTGAVSLPTGWALLDGFNLRPGGCNASVTEFVNEARGIYDIRIVPSLSNPVCAWLSGEYIYGVQIQVSRKIAGKTVVLQGSALAKLAVP